MSPKKLKALIQQEIQNCTNSYIGVATTAQTKHLIAQHVRDIINKFAIGGPIPTTSVEVTTEPNGIMNIKMNVPAEMLPPFYSDRSLIGVLSENDWVYSATIFNKQDLLSVLNEKFQENPIKCFESDIMPSCIKLPLEDFEVRSFSYGTVLLHKNGEWFIQDNANYDQNNMIKLSSYLLFQ